MNILILYDEIPENPTPDQEDTEIQARAVADAIHEFGHNWVFSQYPMVDLLFYQDVFFKREIDLVFNLVESFKEKGQFSYFAPASLDNLKIPYTGNSTEAIFMTSNKLIAKKMMSLAGIPTPEWGAEGFSQYYESLMIKSVWEHGSIKGDGPTFKEQYIDGKEFHVSLIEKEGAPIVLPVSETQFIDWPDKPKIVDYQAKWDKESFGFKHTIRGFGSCSNELFRDLSSISLNIWHLFNLRGYARIDFRVYEDIMPYVIDINANPCLSPDSGFVASVKEAGIEYNQMIQYIIDAAIRH